MKPQATAGTCDAQCRTHMPILNGYSARCACVAADRSLAVVKMERARGTSLAPELTTSLRQIAGVSQVRLDASRGTIQILYDGKQQTVEGVHRFLVVRGFAGPESAGPATTSTTVTGYR